jgi:hypothetical protein
MVHAPELLPKKLQPQLLPFHHKLDCLLLPFSSTLDLYLTARPQPTRVDTLVMASNNRQGWNLMAVVNTLAYYDTASITAVKNFSVQEPVFTTLNFLRNLRIGPKN